MENKLLLLLLLLLLLCEVTNNNVLYNKKAVDNVHGRQKLFSTTVSVRWRPLNFHVWNRKFCNEGLSNEPNYGWVYLTGQQL